MAGKLELLLYIFIFQNYDACDLGKRLFVESRYEMLHTEWMYKRVTFKSIRELDGNISKPYKLSQPAKQLYAIDRFVSFISRVLV